MTTQPESNDKAEQKVSKDELSDKQFDKASGGGVSLNFTQIKIDYKTQGDTGTTDTTTK